MSILYYLLILLTLFVCNSHFVYRVKKIYMLYTIVTPISCLIHSSGVSFLLELSISIFKKIKFYQVPAIIPQIRNKLMNI